VGNANLLAGHITASHGNGWYTVRLEGGVELRGRASVAGWRPGADGAALVCIRPENVAAAADGFAATVRHVGYLGAVQRCELVAGPVVLRADLPAQAHVAEGSQLTLRISQDCVVLLPED
jgi:ABC-type sugar transport system ATPase subunit